MKVYVFNDFAHQVLGNVYYCFLEYLTKEVYPRFKTKTIATYHRAINYLMKSSSETVTRLPAICLDPTTPFTFEEKSNTLWRSPVAAGLTTRLFDPIYRDDNIIMTPGFVRCSSTVEVYAWFDSIYEQLDFNMRCLQLFRGLNRWFKPFGMEVFCPVPEKIYYQELEELTEYTINWTPNFGLTLLETIDKQIPVVQMYMAPMVRATSLNSAETRDKDSGDEYATCAMSITCEIEAEIPAYYVLDVNWQLTRIDVDLIIPGLQNVSNYIPRTSFYFTENTEEETNPDIGIVTPETVVYKSLEYKDYFISKSLVIPVTKKTENVELPDNPIPDNGDVVCLVNGRVVKASWFEDEGKQYIHLDEDVEGMLVVNIMQPM